MARLVLRLCTTLTFLALFEPRTIHAGWTRHAIDDASRGADGVKAADINADGRLDLVTGWEEGGRIRVCLQPEVEFVADPWPSVTIGAVASPEDAVFCDLDRDGVFEAISCCEGSTRAMYVHRCLNQLSILDDASWETNEISLDVPRRQWMFATPLRFAGDNTARLVCGAKGSAAEIGILACPGGRDDAAAWDWQPLHPAGWIMSINTLDFDADGDCDILYSDRRGENRGVHWFERIDDQTWRRHTIGGVAHEVMFLDTSDLDNDGKHEVVVASRDAGIILLARGASHVAEWQERIIPLTESCGTGKGVAVFDVDRDGDDDIAFSCENADGKIGVGWLSAPDWKLHDISGTAAGVKFDLLLPMDVNGDGWMDLVTCEERDNLGLIWYENPADED